MSTVMDVSNKLGEYLLQGWVLTDKTCPTPGCRRVPLMRSPNGATWFCPSCEGDGRPSDASSQSLENHILSSPSLTSSTHYSRPDTPPTEVSSTLSSPTFALPAETEDSIRRRQQSDQASAEIGKRLLKGWAMLADECPNNSCYGIPLVRPPKTGGVKDPRKECVVCGTVYMEEKDAHGFEKLVPEASTDSMQQGSGLTDIAAKLPITQPKDNGKTVDRNETPMTVQTTLPSLHRQPQSTPGERSSLVQSSTAFNTVTKASSTIYLTLDGSANALETVLHALSQRLLLLSGQPVLDPTALGQTADAISKTAQALSHIRQLARSET